MSTSGSFSLPLIALLLSALAVQAAPPVVSNVHASQRAGTGLVDIYYDLASASNSLTISMLISTNSGTSFNVSPTSVSGDVGSGITPGTGKHILWNADADLAGLYFPNVKVRIIASDNSLDDGLVAYYPLNGNANDASGDGHNGVNVGAQLCADQFGNPSGAFLFNGTNYVVVPDFASIDFPTGLTFSAWVKPILFNVPTNGTTVTAGVVSKPRSPNGTGFRLGFYLAQAEMAIYNNYPYDIHENASEATNQWIFTAGTVNTNSIDIYVNGSLKQQAIGDGYPSIQGTQPLYIGTEGIVGEGDRSFRGAVDDVRIYNRALSPTEVLQLYDSSQ